MARSAPSVVDPHVAGVDGRLVRVGVEQGADRAHQGRPVAAGQVDPPDRALEEDVAGEDRVLAAHRVGDVAGAVAGGEDDVELEAGQLQRLAAARPSRRPRSSRTGRSPASGTKAMMSASTGTSISRAVDRRAGGRRDRRDGADVVEVAVGDEDRLDLRRPSPRPRRGSAPAPRRGRRSGPRSEPSRRSRKQFSATAPTVSIWTSRLTCRSPVASRIRARSRLRHIIVSM